MASLETALGAESRPQHRRLANPSPTQGSPSGPPCTQLWSNSQLVPHLASGKARRALNWVSKAAAAGGGAWIGARLQRSGLMP